MAANNRAKPAKNFKKVTTKRTKKAAKRWTRKLNETDPASTNKKRAQCHKLGSISRFAHLVRSEWGRDIRLISESDERDFVLPTSDKLTWMHFRFDTRPESTCRCHFQ